MGINAILNKMATFCWDYIASHGVSEEPRGYQNYVICIGLSNEAVLSMPLAQMSSEDVYTIHIDPKLPRTSHSPSEGYIGSSWGDILRIPTEGQHAQEHPLLRAARRSQITWIGNVKLFRSIYDLMIAASHHADNSTYHLASRDDAGNYKTIVYDVQYHPMSGKLPPSIPEPRDRMRLLSILLGLHWFSIAVTTSGHLTPTTIAGIAAPCNIMKNLYSVWSANTSCVVLLVSYYGLGISGDGTLQEKLDGSREFRQQVAQYAVDVVNVLGSISGASNDDDLVRSFYNACGVTVH